MKEIKVEVQRDHLERQASARRPILAIAELVWNALDADASHVDVVLEREALGALRAVVVRDDGHGIGFTEAEGVFGSLGGSWKRDVGRSRSKKRILHGKAGKGRFRAFALGDRVIWDTRARDDGHIARYKIVGTRERLGVFVIEDPIRADESGTGTEVTIADISGEFPSLEIPDAAQDLTQHLALYLFQTPGASVTYEGTRLDPRSLVIDMRDYPLGDFPLKSGERVPAVLTVIEWRVRTERSLFLCDSQGFALQETPPGIQAPGFDFTAYLKCDVLKELDERDALPLEELEPHLRGPLVEAKKALRAHFRSKQAQLARSVVEEWKRDNVYPYAGDPKGVIEEAERQVFDVVALNVHAYLPDFDKADPLNKRFSLRLLREAIEESPSAVQRIIQDVLDLPAEKREDLAQLLRRTTLGAVINASRTVADRLDFLRGLEILLFDPKTKEQLLERRQLHKILEDHTWLFGEEFALTVSDKSLTDVLRKHDQLLGRPKEPEVPVVVADGSTGIIDLMLSRRIPLSRAEEREHLVIELKRPTQAVDSGVADQVFKYAFAVAEDERFRDTKTRWVFWAISNEVSTDVRRRVRQKDRPVGLLHQDDDLKLTVWVRSWSEVLEACRGRLQFFQDSLKYVADDESAVALLKRLHAKYLPPIIADLEVVSQSPRDSDPQSTPTDSADVRRKQEPPATAKP